MTKQEIYRIIQQIKNRIIIGNRDNGKILLYQIVAEIKFNVLEELRNEIENYNDKEKNK